MSAFGITVLNFSPRQIRDEPEQVIAAIRDAIERRRGQMPLAIRTVLAA